MSKEQRIRAWKRQARNSFYRDQSGDCVYWRHGVTNWRMLIARRFKISIEEVRKILGEKLWYP